MAPALSLGLLGVPVTVFGTTAPHLVTDTGTTTFGRFAVPVAFVVLLALPFVLAHAVFHSDRHRGRERPTAAVPALRAGSMAPFAAPCLVLMYAD
ncbi:hypothetical protein ACFQ7A_06450 [Streptomyces sp. NPDC056528]|uniref:hypothetical protein n=1 Tax=Streptomyces sp. NPDC056528 TaxID=3345854 RepID=UPI0036BD82BB